MQYVSASVSVEGKVKSEEEEEGPKYRGEFLKKVICGGGLVQVPARDPPPHATGDSCEVLSLSNWINSLQEILAIYTVCYSSRQRKKKRLLTQIIQEIHYAQMGRSQDTCVSDVMGPL